MVASATRLYRESAPPRTADSAADMPDKSSDGEPLDAPAGAPSDEPSVLRQRDKRRDDRRDQTIR
jgi:hypothetical protein